MAIRGARPFLHRRKLYQNGCRRAAIVGVETGLPGSGLEIDQGLEATGETQV